EQGRKEEGVRKLVKLSLAVTGNQQAMAELDNAEQLVAALRKGDNEEAKKQVLKALEMQMDAALEGVNPCEDEELGMVKRVWNVYKVAKATPQVLEAVRDRDVLKGLTKGAEVWGLMAEILGPCFVAGTPVETPEGAKPIEQLVEGDLVLSRDEKNPAGAVKARGGQEAFRRAAGAL